VSSYCGLTALPGNRAEWQPEYVNAKRDCVTAIWEDLGLLAF